jgi:uncharacterized protein YigA (DUF484 family)
VKPSPPPSAKTPAARKPKKPALPDEQGVVAWLRLHPDFFAEHLDLLERMHVPHPCGDAVSLVQVRLELLREKTHALQEQLDELLDIARGNDVLMLRLNRLILKLLVADSPQAALNHLSETLSKGFEADLIALRLNAAVTDAPFTAELTPDQERLFETLFAGGQPKCGVLAEAQRRALFGDEAEEALSCAVVPLRHGALRGVMAIGSRDPRRFHPGMGYQFLQQLGEVVAARLDALLNPARG